MAVNVCETHWIYSFKPAYCSVRVVFAGKLCSKRMIIFAWRQCARTQHLRACAKNWKTIFGKVSTLGRAKQSEFKHPNAGDMNDIKDRRIFSEIRQCVIALGVNFLVKSSIVLYEKLSSPKLGIYLIISMCVFHKCIKLEFDAV